MERNRSEGGVLELLLVAAVYFGSAKAGLGLAGSNQSITAVWPPTGVALAAVLLLGYRIWPAIALSPSAGSSRSKGSVGAK